MEIFLLILFGLLGGILGGMGMGGGTLLIPLLTIFAKISQIESQAINLIAFIPMAIIALIIHTKNKLVNFKVSIPLVITGVIFSVLGSMLANSLNALTLKVLFGIFLVALGLFQIGSLFFFKKDEKQ
ncbi:MAG: sulfite exporter TauE/SafE family protein [Clostridiales bacterium]|nr:sulfite exporter TauE/SafE family protein [Clostridiales bacterium]